MYSKQLWFTTIAFNNFKMSNPLYVLVVEMYATHKLQNSNNQTVFVCILTHKMYAEQIVNFNILVRNIK